jgi:hypothetical protein
LLPDYDIHCRQAAAVPIVSVGAMAVVQFLYIGGNSKRKIAASVVVLTYSFHGKCHGNELPDIGQIDGLRGDNSADVTINKLAVSL